MDVMQAIMNRRSVRQYSDRPIPDDVQRRMMDALRLAPSACNYQPWRFVLVAEAERRQALATACNRQPFIAEAPLIVVGVGYPDQAYQHMGGRGNSVDIDVAIALDHLTLAAAAEGLGTCWIGAFDEDAVKKILNVPERGKVVALTPLGYPASPDLIQPVTEDRRKQGREVFIEETFT